eukprot:COSAG01_NODE_73619_length_240_cov_60.014184_1_plen_59_part_01
MLALCYIMLALCYIMLAMLADAGWCWLMLADAGWCWLMLVDAGCNVRNVVDGLDVEYYY